MNLYQLRVLSPVPRGPFRGTIFTDRIGRAQYRIEADRYGRRLAFLLENQDDEVHIPFPAQPFSEEDLSLLVVREKDESVPGLIHSISLLLSQSSAQVAFVRRFESDGPLPLLDRITDQLRGKGYQTGKDVSCSY